MIIEFFGVCGYFTHDWFLKDLTEAVLITASHVTANVSPRVESARQNGQRVFCSCQIVRDRKFPITWRVKLSFSNAKYWLVTRLPSGINPKDLANIACLVQNCREPIRNQRALHGHFQELQSFVYFYVFTFLNKCTCKSNRKKSR